MPFDFRGYRPVRESERQMSDKKADSAKRWQMHTQRIDDAAQTEFVEQGGPFARFHEFGEWLGDVQVRHGPLPERTGWMVCDEDSPHFVAGKGAAG